MEKKVATQYNVLKLIKRKRKKSLIMNSLVWRLLAVLFFALMAFAGSGLVDDVNQGKVYKTLLISTEDMTSFTQGWAKKLFRQVGQLSEDPRVSTALRFKKEQKVHELRRVLFEFGYIKASPNVYIFAPHLPQKHVYPAGAVVPSEKMLEMLEEIYASEYLTTMRSLKLDEEDYLVRTALIVDEENGNPLGLGVMLDKATRLFSRHHRPLFNMLPPHHTFMVDLDASGGPTVFMNILGIKKKSGIFWPSRFLPNLDGRYNKYITLDDELNIVVASSVPLLRGWRLGMGVEKSEIKKRGKRSKVFINLFCYMGIIFILLPFIRMYFARLFNKFEKAHHSGWSSSCPGSGIFHVPVISFRGSTGFGPGVRSRDTL